MSENQFNTLLQLIARHDERLEQLHEEIAQVRGEMKQGFVAQGVISSEILAHVDERFNEQDHRIQAAMTHLSRAG